MTDASSPSNTSANATASRQQAPTAKAANLGQQLLSQLQGQSGLTANANVGVDLGRDLLQQLQQGVASSPAVPQQAAASATFTQTDAGRALLAQLQRSPTQQAQPAGLMAEPMAQPMVPPMPQQPQQGLGGNAAAVSFEQLLRGAAASQQPRAQPVAQPQQQPVADFSAAVSFDQLLRDAAANQQPRAQPAAQPQQPVARPSVPSVALSFEQLLQDAAASQGGAHAKSHQVVPPPGFAFGQQPSQVAAVAAVATSAAGDAGRMLLQQLQQGALQATALRQQQLQQPPGFPSTNPQQGLPGSHTRNADQAGKFLLQQLQRASVSDVAAASGPVGAVAGASQPMPSAPPAPTSVLLQNAADSVSATGAPGFAQPGRGMSRAITCCLSCRKLCPACDCRMCTYLLDVYVSP